MRLKPQNCNLMHDLLQGSYLAHTQGKKHQANLAKRAARDAKEAPAQPAPMKPMVEVKKFVKIGRPGYKGEHFLFKFSQT